MVSDIALTSRKESRPVAEDKRKIWTFILNSFKAYEGEAWSRELGKPRGNQGLALIHKGAPHISGLKITGCEPLGPR